MCHRMLCVRIAVSEKYGCSGVHVVVAKESDLTEHMIHTGGEQIQGNKTCSFRDRGPRSGENGGRGGGRFTLKPQMKVSFV